MPTITQGDFEWDKAKNHTNITKHKIDFMDATRLFDGVVLEAAARGVGSEKRILAIGQVEGVEMVVIYTMRHHRRRIISVRKARKYEKETYHRFVSGSGE